MVSTRNEEREGARLTTLRDGSRAAPSPRDGARAHISVHLAQLRFQRARKTVARSVASGLSPRRYFSRRGSSRVSDRGSVNTDRAIGGRLHSGGFVFINMN